MKVVHCPSKTTDVNAGGAARGSLLCRVAHFHKRMPGAAQDPHLDKQRLLCTERLEERGRERERRKREKTQSLLKVKMTTR